MVRKWSYSAGFKTVRPCFFYKSCTSFFLALILLSFFLAAYSPHHPLVGSVEMCTYSYKYKQIPPHENAWPVSRLEYQSKHNLIQTAMRKIGGRVPSKVVLFSFLSIIVIDCV